MYAIAFFTTVILFSVFLFNANKIDEYITSHKSKASKADIDIRPVVKHFHMGHYRFSA